MKFYGKITVARYAEDNWNAEITEIYADHFEASSIQAAKTYLTKLANTTELFSWIQSWDNAKRTYTGKDLRWKPWSSPPATYKQKTNGVEVAFSTRMSERESGETIYPKHYDKYGKSAQYRVDIALHWRFKGND